MKLGILVAGRGPDDIAKRLEQAREAGFGLCQLNFHQTGLTRADMMAVADSMLEHDVRPFAVGCYINPLRPDDPSHMGACRADLDVILHSLDILGARRVVFWSGTHADTAYDDHPDNAADSSLHSLRSLLTEVVGNTRARHYYLVIEPWRSHVLRHEDDILRFQNSLDPVVSERVRYVLDAPNLISAERYADRDRAARQICSRLGPLSAIVHLKDIVMPPDGEDSPAAPFQGKLDYPAYLDTIFANAAPGGAAIIRNVPHADYGSIREQLIAASPRWELS